MNKILSAAAVGLGLLAAPASALSIDLSDGAFDTVNRSWYFNDIAVVGSNNVNLRVTTSPALDSINDARNQDFDTNYLQANLRALKEGNASTFTFSFVNDADVAVTVANLEIGVYDIDYEGLEVIRAINPVNVTTTVASELTVNIVGGVAEVIGAPSSNVPNPQDFANLTAPEQNAAVLFNFGTTSSFQIEAAVIADPSNRGGRNFYFGNVAFTEPTQTFEVAPIPLPPAVAMMLLGLGGIFGLRFRKRASA